MPEAVKKRVAKIQRKTGLPKGRAIAIAKSQGQIKQRGKHLAKGPKFHGKAKKPRRR